MSSDKKDVRSNIKQMQPKAECTKKIFHSLQKLAIWTWQQLMPAKIRRYKNLWHR